MAMEIPVPGELDPWHLLGYLEARLEGKGRLTKSDWNEAVLASRRHAERVRTPKETPTT